MKKIPCLALAAILALAVLTGCAPISAFPAVTPASKKNPKSAEPGSLDHLLALMQSKDGLCVKADVTLTSNIAAMDTALEFYQKDGNIASVTHLFGSTQRSVIKNGSIYIMIDERKSMAALSLAAAGSLPLGKPILPSADDLSQAARSGNAELNGRKCTLYSGNAGGAPMRLYIDKETGEPVRLDVVYEGNSLRVDYREFSSGGIDGAVFDVPTDYKPLTYMDLVNSAR